MDTFEAGDMMPFFPVIGLIIGGMLVGVDWFACLLWPTPVAALLDVLFLIWITGALHLDGVGDSADGLYGRREKEKALAIMKDSRLGAMGSIAIVSVIAVKWISIAHIVEGRALVLLVVPVLGRCAQLIGMRSLPYGRAEGIGRDFIEAPMKWPGFLILLIPVVISAFLGLMGFLLLACFVALTIGTLFYYKKRLGCITGDMLGALCEVCKAGLFLIAALNILN